MVERPSVRTWPGHPYPLGATWDGEGVNFVLFLENSTAVEFRLFDRPEAGQKSHCIRLKAPTDQIWHVYIPGLWPGHHYGYRVYGPYRHEEGYRFNSAKLLIDPYAKSITGAIEWSDATFDYRIVDPEAVLSRDDRDNAANGPKSVVIDPAITWGGDTRLKTLWE